MTSNPLIVREQPVPYRLTRKGERAYLPAGLNAIRPDREADLRAENRRQKAAYWDAITGFGVLTNAEEREVIRAHRAALRSQVDRLALRLSFSEAAAKVIYGDPCGAYWRDHQLCEYCAGYPEIVDMRMAQTDRPDVAGVPKSELVRANFEALNEEKRQHWMSAMERGDIDSATTFIGERSPLP